MPFSAYNASGKCVGHLPTSYLIELGRGKAVVRDGMVLAVDYPGFHVYENEEPVMVYIRHQDDGPTVPVDGCGCSFCEAHPWREYKVMVTKRDCVEVEVRARTREEAAKEAVQIARDCRTDWVWDFIEIEDPDLTFDVTEIPEGQVVN